MSFKALFVVNQIDGDTSVMGEGGNIGTTGEIIDDTEGMTVLHCTYDFNQPMDHVTGTTRGGVRAGLIKIDIESDRTTGLLGWLINNQRGDGSIIFFSRQEIYRKEKELQFEDANLVAFSESFNAINDGPMVTHLEIYARKITMNNEDGGYSQEWQGDD